MPNDILRRLRSSIPQVHQWIDEFLACHADEARSVSSLGFRRLADCFPQKLLDRAKVVTVARVPFPPVDRFGLPEMAPMLQMTFAGITFKDTIFLQQGQSTEILHFHELVHVVQWGRLGVYNFLLAYGAGLLQSGYDQCPLEQMAYTLQRRFESDTLPHGLMHTIEEHTDAIWNQTAPAILGGRNGA